ncbi:CHAT domain-containing protein [Thermopolyspora sp. NPDC052614]|uniref:CHAT domain-containing protein n=1 Tax=Thermopolyspora sp. NPDC052614 TaxID=3155682 RepID=UPI0034430649
MITPPDSPGLSDVGVADAAALRRLGIDLVAQGDHDRAAPILDRAAELYAAAGAPTGAAGWIDLIGLRNAQVHCAIARRAFHRLPDLLVAAADARRAIALGPDAHNPWRDALVFLASTAADLHETLRTLADAARAAPACPDHVRAAAETSAATVATVCEAIRSADARAGDPDSIEAAAAHLDRLLADARRTLSETADRLDAERPAGSAGGDGAAGPQEVATVTVRGGVDLLDLLRRHLERADPPGAARLVRRLTRDASVAIAGYVETWRALLDDHWEKILSTGLALPFYERMVALLLDIDASEDALVASEMSRARAFADALRAGRAASATRGPGQAPPMTRPRLRDILARHDATVVEYFLLGDALLVWVCPRGGDITVIRSDLDRARLIEAVDEFNRLARTPMHDAASRTAMADVLRLLGAMLWDIIPPGLLPADPDAPITVVPHAELFRVPFGALRDEAGTYLVQRHAIRMLPALALAPDLTTAAATTAAVTTDTAKTAARREGPVSLVALVNPSPLPEGPALDWTERHFDEITDLYGEHHTVYTGPDADLATLRRVASQGTVLYLGTHARAIGDADADPLMSYLVLAPSPGHDGFLRAKDVPALGLGADLVILAACETGGGAVTADGVIGLSRAFLTSGPTGLITTLYPVGERAALNLMTAFHEAWLLDGHDMVTALRRAQCEAAALQPAAAQEPHLWAAFTFFGLGRNR